MKHSAPSRHLVAAAAFTDTAAMSSAQPVRIILQNTKFILTSISKLLTKLSLFHYSSEEAGDAAGETFRIVLPANEMNKTL